MSGGFATARCAQPERSDVAAFLASLEANGLALRNPLTGRLTALDETGEQVDVAERELVDRLWTLPAGETFTFQLWLDEAVDVVCEQTWSRPSVAAYRFSLDGLGTDRRRVREAIRRSVDAQPGGLGVHVQPDDGP